MVEVAGPETALKRLQAAITEPVSVTDQTRPVREVVTIGVPNATLAPAHAADRGRHRDDFAETTMKLFGTDGIRGKAGNAPLVPETVARVGAALVQIDAVAETRLAQPPACAIVIGRDTRESGAWIEDELARGLSVGRRHGGQRRRRADARDCVSGAHRGF